MRIVFNAKYYCYIATFEMTNIKEKEISEQLPRERFFPEFENPAFFSPATPHLTYNIRGSNRQETVNVAEVSAVQPAGQKKIKH